MKRIGATQRSDIMSWEDILKRSVDDFLSEYLRLTREIERNKKSGTRRDLLMERRELEQSIPENMQDAFYDSLEEMDAKRERDRGFKEQQERAIARRKPYVPKQKGQKRNKQPSTKRTRSLRQAAIEEKKRRKELEARERRNEAAKRARDERRGL